MMKNKHHTSSQTKIHHDFESRHRFFVFFDGQRVTLPILVGFSFWLAENLCQPHPITGFQLSYLVAIPPVTIRFVCFEQRVIGMIIAMMMMMMMIIICLDTCHVRTCNVISSPVFFKDTLHRRHQNG